MKDAEEIHYLEKMGQQLRIDSLETIYAANSWHLGSCFSAAEIMSVLYFRELRIDPQNPNWEDRDRFIMSKGHASVLWYSALAEKGFFPKEELATYRKINSRLQGHPQYEESKRTGYDYGFPGQRPGAWCWHGDCREN